MQYPQGQRPLLAALVLLAALGAGALFVRWHAAESAGRAKDAARQVLFEQAKEGVRYVAEPGDRREGEAQRLLMMDAYWHTRVTYPTGRFEFRWLQEAARQDKVQVRTAVPAGEVIYNRRESQSPLALDPARWTSIGPQPQDSNTCQAPCFTFGRVAGRVNDIVIDPVTPSVAYLAADGGGVWKTTNCCSPLTTWAAVTDDPIISTVAIGDLTIDRSNHNNVYAATGDLTFGSFSFGSAGVLKSTNGGTTWAVKGADVFNPVYPQPPGQFPQYQSVGKVEVDPRNSNTLIAGAKTGVYLSYDGGDNWAGPCLPDAFPGQRQDITGLLVQTATGGIANLFVAVGTRGYSTTVQTNLAENGANGIYKTTVPASGCPATWTLLSRPNNGWPVGTGSGIPVYVPGGNPLGRIDLAQAPSAPNTIYAQVQAIIPGLYGAVQRGGQLGLWRTTDGGTTWTQRSDGNRLNTDVTTSCPSSLVGGDYPQNWYDQGVAVDPNDPNTLFMDTFDIWKSTDGGATFRDVTCGYGSLNVPAQVHVDQHALAFLPGSSSTILAGSDGGVYVSLTANLPQPNWVALNNTLSTIEFYSGDITANFATSAIPGANAGAQDNGSSVWTGDPNAGPFLWRQRLGGDGMFARIEPVLGQRWYFENQNGGLNVSTGGPDGALISAKGSWDTDRLSFVFPYEIYKYDCPATGCTHMIAGSHRVWETTSGAIPASSWVPISGDLTKNTLADRSFINQLSYAVSLSTTAIVGTNDGNVQYGFGLGTGAAATWVNVTGANTVLPNRPILDVTTDPVNPLVGYAAVGGFNENTPATQGHVFQVTCVANCVSFVWLNKTGNLPNIPVDSILANPRYRQQVFAGTDWGVYYTNNIDAVTPEWFHFNSGMPNVMVWDLAIDRGFTTLAAFTRSRGVFVWPLPNAPFGGTPTPTVTGTPPTATRTPSPRPSSTPFPTTPPSPTLSPTRTGTSTPSPTPLGCGASLPLVEGFESGSLGVFTATSTIGAYQWAVVTGTVNSGVYAAMAFDPDAQSDQQLTQITAVAIPANATQAQLHFAHRYSFEPVDFDGGVLEYTTNGVLWNDAGSLITQGGYTGVITATGGNILAGRQAWVGQSATYPGFQGVTANLLSLSGQSVRFRFRLGSDLNTGAPGWWVDDIAILIVGPCPTGTVSSTPTRTNTPTNTPLPTQTPGGPSATTQPSSTRTSTPTLTRTPTNSPTSTPTNTRPPTQTPGGPSATTEPSNTPTLTPTRTPTSTATNTRLPTQTPGGPSATTEPSSTRTPTNTPTNTRLPTQTPGGPSATPEPSNTPGGPTPCPIQFNDVPSGSTFYDFIRCLACRGIVSGYPCGGPGEPCPGSYFRPNNDVTRGQTAKIVASSANFTNPVPSNQQTFEDVAPGSTFWLFIERLSGRGIVGGYPCGGAGEPCVAPGNRPYFRPNNNVTRGQISKIVSGAAGYTETPTGQTFEDVPPGSTFYLTIERIAVRGIIAGYPCGGAGEPCVAPGNRPYFRPFTQATRGQMSKIAAGTFFPNCATPARR